MSDEAGGNPTSTPRRPQLVPESGDLTRLGGSSYLDSLLEAFGQDVLSSPPPDSEDYSEPNGSSVELGALIADRYEVRGTIEASEDCGVLVHAHDTMLGRDVTLKSLADSAGEGTAEALLHELLVARTVSHPNVCRVHDLIRAGTRNAMLVMEACTTTLRAYIDTRKRHCDEKEYRSLARQLASALEAIHGRGLVHGALNPSNILLDGDRVLVLFGAGTRGPAGNSEPMPASKAQYFAPERVWDTFATRSDDVYALAAILWEVLTGRAPDIGLTPRLDPLLQHALPSLVLGLSVHELRLLYQALSEEPSRRPSARGMHVLGPDSTRTPRRTRKSISPGVPPGARRTAPFVPNDQALLVLTAGAAPNLVGRVITLPLPELTLGRGAQQIDLPDPSVSRAHASLTWQGGPWLLRDLGSGNGIFGAHSYERRDELVLRHGEEAQLGAVRVKLVRFQPNSLEHWRARRFLTTHDGLTGLTTGASFLAALQEESAFAQWAGSTLRIGRFRLVIPRGVAEPVALLALRRFCDAALRDLDEQLPSTGVAGFVHRDRLHNGGEATLFVAMARVRRPEAVRQVVETSHAASQMVPPEVKIYADTLDIDPAPELLPQLGIRAGHPVAPRPSRS